MLAKMNGEYCLRWNKHGGITERISLVHHGLRTLTGTNRWLKHNRLIQVCYFCESHISSYLVQKEELQEGKAF